MSLFSKGNWTRHGIDPDASLDAFKRLLGNPRDLFMSSAFVARTLLLGNPEMDTSVGVNPPCWPCGDAPFPMEQVILDKKVHPVISRQLADETNLEPWSLPETLDESLSENDGLMFGMEDRYWGHREGNFVLLDPEVPVYGFWFVYLKREVLDDVKALKEHSAATTNGQPFGTLASPAKTDITKALESDGLVDYISRKQFPVIIDFRTGDVWAGTATKCLLEALKFWVRRHLGVDVERMGLTMGGEPRFAQLALNVFRDKDLYALERQEAYEQAQKDKAAEGEEVEEADEAPENPVQVEEVPEGFAITDIATYAAPEGTMVVSVGTDALITLGTKGRAAVGAHHPMDAIALLKEIEGSELAMARLSIKDNIGDGIATVSVEASGVLAEATYKGLELDFQGGCNAVLEEGLEGALFDGETKLEASRVNNWWFRYYLRLQKAERMIIEAMATALGFENVEAIKPVARRLMVQEVQVTKGEVDTVADAVEATGDGNTKAVRKAAKKLKDSIQQNLLPGESVTLTGVQEVEIEG